MSDTETLQWGPPPPKTASGPHKYRSFYEALKERPGVWAEYPGSISAASSYAMSNDGFEATFRGSQGDQRAWMRYVGEAQS